MFVMSGFWNKLENGMLAFMEKSKSLEKKVENFHLTTLQGMADALKENEESDEWTPMGLLVMTIISISTIAFFYFLYIMIFKG